LPTGIAECTPDFLASYEHVLTTPLRSVGSNPITTHRAFPPKSGCSRTSTDAKKESMSTCRTIRFSRLSVSELEADIIVRWTKHLIKCCENQVPSYKSFLEELVEIGTQLG